MLIDGSIEVIKALTRVPVFVLVDAGEAGVLEDEAVVAPGRVAVVHRVPLQNVLQKFGPNPTNQCFRSRSISF